MYSNKCSWYRSRKDLDLLLYGTRKAANGVKYNKLPTLRTLTKQRLSFDGPTLLRLWHDNLNTQLWFEKEPNLAFYMLLGTSFMDHVICGNFPSERKRVPWHSQPVAILGEKVRHMENPIIGNSKTGQTIKTQQAVEDEENGLVRVALQIVLNPITQHPVLVTTASNAFHRIDQKQLSANCHIVAVANAVVKHFTTTILPHLWEQLFTKSGRFTQT